jgi:ribosomal protein S18 acetylase RimI-like enzyme
MARERTVESVALRLAAPEDSEALALFASRTFEETFGPDNKPADMADYLSKNFSSEIQRREIADADSVLVLAEDEAKVLAGYAHILFKGAEVELKRLYVDSGWKGSGLGRILVAEVLRQGTARKGSRVWLSVWERNTRAIAFYRKMGFRVCGSATFVLGDDAQTDNLMELSLLDGV